MERISTFGQCGVRVSSRVTLMMYGEVITILWIRRVSIGVTGRMVNNGVREVCHGFEY